MSIEIITLDPAHPTSCLIWVKQLDYVFIKRIIKYQFISVWLHFNMQLSHSLFYSSFVTVVSSVKERIKPVAGWEMYLQLSVLNELPWYIYVLWFFSRFFASFLVETRKVKIQVLSWKCERCALIFTRLSKNLGKRQESKRDILYSMRTRH